jgi:hypothetical protein
MVDKRSSIGVRESTKALLKPYKAVYGSYEKSILELIKSFEEN